MGSIWGRQDPGGPHVGPMNIAIWVYLEYVQCQFVHLSKLSSAVPRQISRTGPSNYIPQYLWDVINYFSLPLILLLLQHWYITHLENHTHVYSLKSCAYVMGYIVWWARLLYLAQSRLRLCSANHRPGYLSNLPCDWPSAAWAYSKQETENGLRFSWRAIFDITACVILPSSCDHIAYECHILQVLKTNYKKSYPHRTVCIFVGYAAVYIWALSLPLRVLPSMKYTYAPSMRQSNYCWLRDQENSITFALGHNYFLSSWWTLLIIAISTGGAYFSACVITGQR